VRIVIAADGLYKRDILSESSISLSKACFAVGNVWAKSNPMLTFCAIRASRSIRRSYRRRRADAHNLSYTKDTEPILERVL